MAYFNHAFNKVFVGTSGFVSTSGTTTTDLTKGEFTFVDPTTWAAEETLNGSTTLSCPLVLVSGSIYQNDKIGPFHGGYKESVKSKIINPKYVHKFYRVDACTPQNMTISVGTTPYTSTEGATCNIPGSVSQKDFLCGETYYLRLDLKGAAVLRFLSRNSYFTADAYTGCCAEGSLAPTPVDPTTVYIAWAKNFMNSPLVAPFIEIEIFDTTGASIGSYDKETYDAAVKAGTLTWDSYSPVAGATGLTAGMYVTGAYIDTRFGDCTFYPNDSILAYVEPVKILASEVDYTGAPCEFTTLCVADVCDPIQGAGFGENVVRELILSEGYAQTPFYTGMDLRVREITQGYDVTNTIDRNAQYTRYFIQHSVPRFNNPTGTFDNDQYLLEVIGDAPANTFAVGANAAAVITVNDVTNISVGMVVSVNGGAYSTQTVLSIDAETNEVTMSGTVAVTDGQSLFFIDATLATFEAFVSQWLENGQGTACVTLQTFGCPVVCTAPAPELG